MTRKNTFLEEWSWFKFNNLGLALGFSLKLYTSVVKGLKLKVRNFWGLTSTFAEVTGENLVEGAFLTLSPSWIGLKQLLWESLTDKFCSYNSLKHSISAEFLLMEGYVQGALRKQLHIAPFVECFKAATLGKPYW